MTESGEVFSWGAPHGVYEDSQLLPRFVEALTGVRARSASAGGCNCLVGTEDGALYSFGEKSPHLGYGIGRVHSPKIVRDLYHKRIASAAVGKDHSLALTAGGAVFAWGENSNGQLGTRKGMRIHSVNKPTNIDGLPLVCSFVAGYATAGYATRFAVSLSGHLFT